MAYRFAFRHWSLLCATLPWVPLALAHGGAAAAGDDSPGRKRIDYASRVAPIFRAHCVTCHGPMKQRGGLDLSTVAGLRKGGASGASVVPKSAAKSLLYQRVTGRGGKPRMPLNFAPLSDDEIRILRDWIDQGAQTTSGPIFGVDILPIIRAKCSGCHNAEKAAGGLNLLTVAGIQKDAILTPGDSRNSDLYKLITDPNPKTRMPLHGKPLSAKEIDKIKAWIDAGANFEMGRAQHWAFLAPVRPNLPRVSNPAWVRNPIDDFVLAKLDKERLRPSPEADKETLIRRVSLDLTGLPPTIPETDAFLKDRSPNAYEKVVDRLLASPAYGERQARPWLDLARYADTNGYEKDSSRTMWPYRDWVIKAFNDNMPFDRFTVEQIAGDMLPGATVADRVATGFNRNTMYNDEGGVDRGEQRWLTLVDRVGTTAETWLGATLQCAQCHDHKFDPFTQKDFYRFLAFFESADEPELDLRPLAVQARAKSLQAEIAASKKALKTAKGQEAIDKKDVLASLEARLAAIPDDSTLVLTEHPGKSDITRVRIKGGYLAPAELVSADTPAFLPKLPGKPDRMLLARWLVDKSNPLTARVTVNRMWELCFGRGIVETSDNFGTQGSLPTHPELLDWLATEFMRNDWNMKAINRLIVTSATYRQDSDSTAALLERDPHNELLSRGPRFRMEAEMIRDATLSEAGLLDTRIGGPSVYPMQPDGIWDSPYNSDKWIVSGGAEKYRRGIYTFWKRTAPYPEFLAFDATSREQCTLRRIRTNTPLQALTLLNDDAAMDAARALATRMETLPKVGEQVRYGFRLCTGREPSGDELNRLVRLAATMQKRYLADPASAKKLAASARAAAMTMVANVLLNLDETITKE